MFVFAVLTAFAAESTVSTSVRTTTTGDTPTFGGEVRHTGPIFLRARMSAFVGATEALFSIVENRADSAGTAPTERTNWIGRNGSFEAAWSPIPNIRVGGIVSSTLSFTKRAKGYLDENSVAADTLGATHMGPQIAVGGTLQSLRVFAVASYEVPIASRAGGADLEGFRTVQTHGQRIVADLETRTTWNSLVFDANVGVLARFASHKQQLQNNAIDQVYTPTHWSPRVGLSVGWVGKAPWSKKS